MKKIDLAQPFEEFLATLSSLPLTDSHISQQAAEPSKKLKLKRVLREIYEAANGRQVATDIGLVGIAPPIAPYLKDKPFFVKTQADFLSHALARLVDAATERPTDLRAPSAFRSTDPAPAHVNSRRPERVTDWRKGSCMRVG
jgi:hypothetical protein